jgi:branched-subunit amino acid aminotransferase/4-amino-4-deoxychorismate lyase
MNLMDEPQAYLNGRFLSAASASLSLCDSGFVLGAAVAERVRTFAGKLFRLDDHLARLEHSLEIIDVDPGMPREEIARLARELVARNHPLLTPGDDLGLTVFVTPGIYPTDASGGPAEPTVGLHTSPLPFRLWADKYRTGEALVTTDVEQVAAKSWPRSLKCRSRMHYYLADRQAAIIERGARALLLDAEGLVVEASTANVMIFTRDRGLLSPPHQEVLPGISLAQVNELAEKLGIPCGEHELTPDDVAGADEVLLTSTPFCLLPVTRFNGRPIGGGAPGQVFRRLLAAWNGLVGIDVAAQAERFLRRAI